jgi:hypothetical protein
MAERSVNGAQRRESIRRRLRLSAKLFSLGAKIGVFALLFLICLLLAIPFRNISQTYWLLCCLVSVVGLCCLIAGHLTISWNSDGYGFNGFGRVVSLYWLLVFGGGLAAAMAFLDPIRYVVLISFVLAIGVSSGATPFFWRGILKNVRPKTG